MLAGVMLLIKAWLEHTPRLDLPDARASVTPLSAVAGVNGLACLDDVPAEQNP